MTLLLVRWLWAEIAAAYPPPRPAPRPPLGGKPRGGGPRIRHAHVVGDRVLSAPGSVTDCRLCSPRYAHPERYGWPSGADADRA